VVLAWDSAKELAGSSDPERRFGVVEVEAWLLDSLKAELSRVRPAEDTGRPGS